MVIKKFQIILALSLFGRSCFSAHWGNILVLSFIYFWGSRFGIRAQTLNTKVPKILLEIWQKKKKKKKKKKK